MSKEHQPTEAGEFNGKRILVTGGTRGIGGAIDERLVGSGGTIPTV
jgi:NAD(P)-dependent dehydrogenase (short-subunit alcohol dehydrogenase family)